MRIGQMRRRQRFLIGKSCGLYAHAQLRGSALLFLHLYILSDILWLNNRFELALGNVSGCETIWDLSARQVNPLQPFL